MANHTINQDKSENVHVWHYLNGNHAHSDEEKFILI